MSWTTPITWTAGQVVGASDLNAQIRDNMNFLLTGRLALTVNREGASDYTNGTTSWADIDATNLILTGVFTSSRALVEASMSTVPPASGSGELDFFETVGAARAGSTNGLVRTLTGSLGTYTPHIHYSWIFTGLSQASHSFKPQFRCDTAGQTFTVKNNLYPVQVMLAEI